MAAEHRLARLGLWRRRHAQAEVHLADLAFRWITGLCAFGAILTVAGLTVQLIQGSWLTLRQFGWGFLTTSLWDPVHLAFGALPFIYGTALSSGLALLLAVPVALGVAIFLAELAPVWARAPLGLLTELLAAVPSVVYGLWGVLVLAPLLRDTVEPMLARTLGFIPLFEGPPLGVGMLAASLILALMILPTIASVSREAMRATPRVLREGALALGATRWEAIRMAVLSYAKAGIWGAILLGLGRALGETMAVTMVIGNRPEIAASLLAPGYTMASVLANEYAEATTATHLSALSEIALLLLGLTVALQAAARLLIWRLNRAHSAGTPP